MGVSVVNVTIVVLTGTKVAGKNVNQGLTILWVVSNIGRKSF